MEVTHETLIARCEGYVNHTSMTCDICNVRYHGDACEFYRLDTNPTTLIFHWIVILLADGLTFLYYFYIAYLMFLKQKRKVTSVIGYIMFILFIYNFVWLLTNLDAAFLRFWPPISLAISKFGLNICLLAATMTILLVWVEIINITKHMKVSNTYTFKKIKIFSIVFLTVVLGIITILCVLSEIEAIHVAWEAALFKNISLVLVVLSAVIVLSLVTFISYKLISIRKRMHTIHVNRLYGFLGLASVVTVYIVYFMVLDLAVDLHVDEAYYTHVIAGTFRNVFEDVYICYALFFLAIGSKKKSTSISTTLGGVYSK